MPRAPATGLAGRLTKLRTLLMIRWAAACGAACMCCRPKPATYVSTRMPGSELVKREAEHYGLHSTSVRIAQHDSENCIRMASCIR